MLRSFVVQARARCFHIFCYLLFGVRAKHNRKINLCLVICIFFLNYHLDGIKCMTARSLAAVQLTVTVEQG